MGFCFEMPDYTCQASLRILAEMIPGWNVAAICNLLPRLGVQLRGCKYQPRVVEVFWMPPVAWLKINIDGSLDISLRKKLA